MATQATQGWWSRLVQLMLTGKIRGFTHSGTMVGALPSKPMKSAELVLNRQDPPSVVVPQQTRLRAEGTMTYSSIRDQLRSSTSLHFQEGVAPGPAPALLAALNWYFCQPFDYLEGLGTLPFYCDPSRVGAFAIAPDDLMAGRESALFRLFVMLSMYQALRDVVIMRQQRELTSQSLRVVADPRFVEHSIANHPCSALLSAEGFEETCDVWKREGLVDCGRCPGVPCHVKEATRVFNRMGDMGKLPTSAWLRLWNPGGLTSVLAEVCNEDSSPTRRAHLLVERFGQVHRVGRKLATMVVSALATPALAPGLTPWFPEVDGNDLVVVDTNVARAIDTLRGPGGAKTYNAREQWVREQAAQIDLRKYRADLPGYSPRLVQEALYTFCSKSNREARRDVCAERASPCDRCIPTICPFG